MARFNEEAESVSKEPKAAWRIFVTMGQTRARLVPVQGGTVQEGPIKALWHRESGPQARPSAQ